MQQTVETEGRKDLGGRDKGADRWLIQKDGMDHAEGIKG